MIIFGQEICNYFSKLIREQGFGISNYCLCRILQVPILSFQKPIVDIGLLAKITNTHSLPDSPHDPLNDPDEEDCQHAVIYQPLIEGDEEHNVKIEHGAVEVAVKHVGEGWRSLTEVLDDHWLLEARYIYIFWRGTRPPGPVGTGHDVLVIEVIT